MKPNVKTPIPSSDQCRTKYPILLVHGAGYRDYQRPNYWGRIPHTLATQGASIFHGEQDAWGTIQENARFLKKRVLDVLKQTGAEKVNLIAHSKGGLEARYMVTHCGISAHIASLTTIATPHYGSVVMDKIADLSDPYYRVMGVVVDGISRFLGDQSPDFYRACRQLSTSFSTVFNKKTPNMPGVYYQSYVSAMKTPFGDLLYWLPFLIVWHYEGENDGLVSVRSAQWGEFQGVLRPSHFRGISHSDIVDLKRLSLPSYDIRNFYVNMVKELKNKGF